MAVLVLAVFAPGAATAQAVRAVRTADYYRLVQVGSAAMSPDGSRVAYVHTSIDEESNSRHREIWLVDTDGLGDARRITSAAHEATNPVWHPNGQLLAFQSDRSGTTEPWFLDLAAGGEAFQIEGVGGAPVFSPDGFWIAFTRPTPPDGEAATRTRSGQSRYATLRDDEALVAERFRGRVYDWMQSRVDGRGYLPDPRDPLATPPRELYVVPVLGGAARQITRLGVSISGPRWSPDGTQIAFVADLQQRDEHTYGRHDLWLVARDGGTTQVTDDEFVYGTPSWMPDGSSLISRRYAGLDSVIEAANDRGAPVDLVQIQVADTAVTNLTASWDLRPGTPMVDGSGVVRFAANVGGESHLFEVGPGGAIVQRTTGRRWLSGFSLDLTGTRVAYVATTPTRPVEIFTANSSGVGETPLTRHNEAFRTQVALAAARTFRFNSTDSQELEGWIMLPRDSMADSDPVPMILAAHGGPHSAYGERFSLQFQLWAAAGYAILYTNPRGSTGYGEDFLWATWGGWGNLDYQDLMSGVGYAVETYNVDDSRLGITGYSYGGFLTNWVITQTNRFVAAISGAGISNWVSDYGTADIPRTKESEFYGAPWERRSGALLWEQSPIKHAEGISTPTLFLHGENDYRVPIEQAEQMYTALRKQEVAARFVRYPDTSHGGWRPWDTVHRYTEELRWWQRYLEQ